MSISRTATAGGICATNAVADRANLPAVEQLEAFECGRGVDGCRPPPSTGGIEAVALEGHVHAPPHPVEHGKKRAFEKGNGRRHGVVGSPIERYDRRLLCAQHEREKDRLEHEGRAPGTADYLVHITTGTHVAQICLFLLTESRHIPARLLQTSPLRRREGRGEARRGPGTFAIIDLDLSKYDRLASRFRKERAEGQSLLKAGIETRSAGFNALIERIEHVAITSRAPILLTGPTGAGKTKLAKRVFELKKSRRQVKGEFAEINCATLRGDAAMSALFGHTKGAFTGATSDRPGLLKKAHEGAVSRRDRRARQRRASHAPPCPRGEDVLPDGLGSGSYEQLSARRRDEPGPPRRDRQGSLSRRSLRAHHFAPDSSMISARHRRFELLTYGSGDPEEPKKTTKNRALGPWSVTPVCQFPLIPKLKPREQPPRPTAWELVLRGGAIPEGTGRRGRRPKPV